MSAPASHTSGARRGHANPRLLVSALLAAAISLAASFGCGPPAAPPPPAGPAAPPRTYTYRLAGPREDWPWNRTIYISLRRGDGWSEPEGLTFNDDRDGSPVLGRPGDAWLALSENKPNAAMQKLLWITEAKGVYGDAADIEVRLAPRATVVIDGDPQAGDDAITFADPKSGARLVAQRDERSGLSWGVWMTGDPDWRGTTDPAPPLPWGWRETRPGTWIVGARTADRQWLVRRVDLSAGQMVPLDVLAQPTGGGTVTCEEPGAEILIGGELPLPAMRVKELLFRARWTHVPPGSHAMRYPSGKTVPFELKDGGEVTLPKNP